MLGLTAESEIFSYTPTACLHHQRADDLRVIDVVELTCNPSSGVVAEGKFEWSAHWPRGMDH